MSQLTAKFPSVVPYRALALLLVTTMAFVSASAQDVSNAKIRIPEGMNTTFLANGMRASNAPVPELPYDGDQQCPPWSHMSPPALGKYEACSVVAQAGVPFRGWIATQAFCGGDQINAISAITGSPFLTVGPLNDPAYPNPASNSFDIYYFAYGSWPERMHLGGTHTWEDPGHYSISGWAFTDCIRPWNRHIFHNFQVNATAVVHQPVAPQSVADNGTGTTVSAHHTYKKFGKITLYRQAPASGTLVMLSTEEPDVIDLETQFGRTGLQQVGGLIYVSTYVYIGPGQSTADFDLLVAASATPGDNPKISATCVGIPGNWLVTNECDDVFKHPKILELTIAH